MRATAFFRLPLFKEMYSSEKNIFNYVTLYIMVSKHQSLKYTWNIIISSTCSLLQISL